MDLNNLSVQELKKLVKKENEEVKKLEEENEKEELILAYKKLQNKKEKLIQEKKKIKQKSKPKSRSITKPKPKFKPKSKNKKKSKSNKKIKSFFDYFQECKGKDIPKDTPEYFKKALLKAKKDYEKGIELEKSALANFAEKYNIEGKSDLLPMDYFKEKLPQIKYFLRNHRNTKVRLLLVCIMKHIEENKDKGYFHSKTHINLEKTEVKVILKEMIKEILNNISVYQKKGSGWYFEEVINLEIHSVEYKPMRRESYIPLPNFIMRKKAIINMENKDDKCFLWSILRYLHSREKHSSRIDDLKKYENDLNFEQINFPIKDKDIIKFEKQNPDLPGINIFSVNENKKIYPLRINKKDCQKTIDLFLYSDENKHYSLIKTFQDW